MSVNSTVNTNVSAPTDINANRGNYPNGVFALDMKTAGGTAAAQTFGLADGDETIGAYVGTIAAVTAAAGTVQTIALNFTRMNSAWDHKDYDIHVSLVSETDATDPSSAGNNVGIASASFTLAAAPAITGTITIRREACLTSANQGLLGCVMLVQVRKRGVTKKNDA
jgi:hypothetical protein